MRSLLKAHCFRVVPNVALPFDKALYIFFFMTLVSTVQLKCN